MSNKSNKPPFRVPRKLIRKVTADKTTPDGPRLDRILGDATCESRQLTLRQVNALVNAIGSDNFDEIKPTVLEAAADLRKSYFNGGVAVMAPIEVGNKCISDCDFCGWRSSNKEMERPSVPFDVVLETVKAQAEYLINKGIYNIELVGGDDPRMVRDEFPILIQEVKKLFPEDVKVEYKFVLWLSLRDNMLN